MCPSGPSGPFFCNIARVVIRTSVEEDGPALALIDQDTWSQEISPMPARAAGTPSFDERTPPENILVACEDGHVVGFAQLRAAPMAASSGHVQELNGMAVAPEYQGRGIGHLLLAAARDEAVRRGARRLTLRVLGSNERALGLYLACGYHIEGRLKGQYWLGGRYVDDIFMALELAGGG
jgi:ribosomal protein S18 acetylase RimI-like enzyme